jgi:hypothetical protein
VDGCLPGQGYHLGIRAELVPIGWLLSRSPEPGGFYQQWPGGRHSPAHDVLWNGGRHPLGMAGGIIPESAVCCCLDERAPETLLDAKY